MPYRDELEALRKRVAALSAERDDLASRLERAHAALASAVAEMAALPAAAEIPWRSLHGGEPVWVRFVNDSDRKVSLRWISYGGAERVHGTLVSGGRVRLRSYVAHLWRMVDAESGEVLLQRYVRAGPDPEIRLHG